MEEQQQQTGKLALQILYAPLIAKTHAKRRLYWRMLFPPQPQQKGAGDGK